MLRRLEYVEEWHDRAILPGDDWEPEIFRRLEEADVILLLISSDFLASDYCSSKEMTRAVERHDRDEARVIPVFLRHCDWKGAPFGKLQGVPTDTHPVESKHWSSRDEAFALVAKAIREAIEAMRAKAAVPPVPPPAPPAPVPLPSAPPPPSDAFTGREKELAAIQTALARRGRVALYGMSGVGKTQLARKYAADHAAGYPLGVHGLRAESAAVLGEDVLALATRLGLPEAKEGVEASVPALRHWMETHAGALVVLDNAPDRAALRDVLPTKAGAHVLVTTQAPDWRPQAEPVEVRRWEPGDGAVFLLERTGRPADERDDAVALARDLDGLPLALEQAAAYVNAKGLSLADYLARFRAYPADLLDRASEATDYPRSVAATLGLALDRLAEEAPAALQLLQACAFLDADAIPETLFRDHPGAWPEPLDTTRRHDLTWDDAVEALLRSSLLRRESGLFSVHRLVQAVARARMEEAERATWARAAFDALDALFPRDIPGNVAVWPACAALAPHALAVIEHVEEHDADGDAPISDLLNRLGLYAYARADYAGAQTTFERALALNEAVLGPEHPATLVSVNNLAYLLQARGDLDGAEPLYRRALAGFEKTLGPEHPTTRIVRGNLESLRRRGGGPEKRPVRRG